MKRILGAICLTLAQAAAHAGPAPCGGPDILPHADIALPHVAAGLKAGELSIAVIGSGSSLLGPQAGSKAAYPGRLQAALEQRFPGLKVMISVAAKPRLTAAEMAVDLPRILRDEKPALVVWQTGTVDAIRGVDPDEFRATLDGGLDAIRTAGADAMLMNMQYSPRMESIIALDAYIDIMRWAAFQHDAPLFDRFHLMKQWNETGIFDLFAATRDFGLASRVHACLGRLLADFIVEAAEMAHSANPPDAPSVNRGAN